MSFARRWLATGLALQRHATLLPGPVRRTGRKILGSLSSADDRADLNDWSTPLLTSAAVSVPHCYALESGDSVGPPASVVRPVARLCAVEDGLPRCLLVSGTLDVGGLDEVVTSLALRLPGGGVETAVLHAIEADDTLEAPSGRLGRELKARGVHVAQAGRQAARQWIREWQPNVINGHGAPEWVVELAGDLGVPYVETVHMPPFYDRQDRSRPPDAAAVVTVSELLRRQYLHEFPMTQPEKVVVIPNAVDDVRRAPVDRRSVRRRLGIKDEFVFVSLARHCVQKNSYALLEAFDQAADRCPDMHLVIAGRPDDRLYLSQMLTRRDSLRACSRIHLRDHHNRPAELLALADGFVLDSFFEGWSLASMEALYAGVPVVLSEVGGAREQVGDDARRGFVIANPLNDPLRVDRETMRSARFARQANQDALIAAMLSLAETRTERARGRARLAAESASRFAPSQWVSAHARLLSGVAGEGRVPSARPPLLLHRG